MPDIKVGTASIKHTEGTYPVLKNHDATINLTFDVVSAIQKWLNSGRPAASALLVGGPRSMEIISVEADSPQVILTTPTSVQYGALCETICTNKHVYRRVSFGDTDGVLPFTVYEHESIQGHNVNRRVKEIEREKTALSSRFISEQNGVQLAEATCSCTATDLADAQEFVSRLETQIEKARTTFEQASNYHVKAEKQVSDAIQKRDFVKNKLINLDKERTKIAYDHGF